MKARNGNLGDLWGLSMIPGAANKKKTLDVKSSGDTLADPCKNCQAILGKAGMEVSKFLVKNVYDV